MIKSASFQLLLLRSSVGENRCARITEVAHPNRDEARVSLGFIFVVCLKCVYI